VINWLGLPLNRPARSATFARNMSESKEPPRLPDVVDEAGPSPRWLPWLGVGLLCLCALLIAAQATILKQAGDAATADPAQEGTASPGAAAEPAVK
jgi:hypothetical protein